MDNMLSLAPVDIPTAVHQGKQRLHPYIRETPLDYSPLLSHLVNGQVFLKLEN